MIKNLTRFPLPGPIRGFNDTDEEIKLPPNMLVDVLNYSYVKNGITTREGFEEHSVSGLPTDEAINALYKFTKDDGQVYLLVVTDGGVYVQGAVGVFTALTTGLASGYPFYTTTLSNRAIISSEGNAPRKCDGATVLPLAVTAPVAAPTSAVGGVGVLTGDYRYKITFVSALGAETNPSPASATVTPATELINLSNIPLGGTDVVSRKVYRTLSGGTLFYYLDTIGNNTATAYSDNIPDSQVSTDLAPWTYDTPPSGLRFLTAYKKYLFGVTRGEPTVLYHSYSSTPETFYTDASLGFILDIGGEDGEEIIGLAPLRDNLYVFKDRSTWPIIGSTPDDFQVIPQPINQSLSLHHRSISVVDYGQGDMLVGVNQWGFFAFDGYSFRDLGVQKDAGVNISGFWSTIDKNQLRWATGYNDTANKQYLCFLRRAGMGYNDRVLVWDYYHNSLSIWTLKGNTMEEWNGELLFGSSQADGKIHKVGGLNDDGAAIEQIAELPWWDAGKEHYVSFRFLYLNVVQWGDYAPDVRMYIDGRNQATSLSLSGGAAWGSAQWVTDGGSHFITADIPIRNSLGVNYKGRFLKVRFEHSGLNEPLTWLDASLLFTPSKENFRGTATTGLGGLGI